MQHFRTTSRWCNYYYYTIECHTGRRSTKRMIFHSRLVYWNESKCIIIFDRYMRTSAVTVLPGSQTKFSTKRDYNNYFTPNSPNRNVHDKPSLVNVTAPTDNNVLIRP